MTPKTKSLATENTEFTENKQLELLHSLWALCSLWQKAFLE